MSSDFIIYKSGCDNPELNIGQLQLQLGATGNRTNLSETVVTNGARSYAGSYDTLYRLTNETISGAAPTGTLGYGLDGVGNRTSRSSTIGNLAAQTFIYNPNDWLTSTDKYDSDGNTVTNVSNQPYFYDYEDRIMEGVKPEWPRYV